jgi:hypothetical protein
MPCNASYARFIFGKFFTSTIILYALLFAQKFYSCKKWVLHFSLAPALIGASREAEDATKGDLEVEVTIARISTQFW